MHGRLAFGNREIPRPSVAERAADRVEKSKGSKSTMNERGKSDDLVVPRKSPNKADLPAAEAMEGSGSTKGNSPEHDTLRTQRRDSVPSAIERVLQVAGRSKKGQFMALLHHVSDVDRLRTAYVALSRDAAAGLRERLANFGLELHASRTRPIEVRSVRWPRSATSRPRQGGDVRVPRLHAHLREDEDRCVHGLAANDTPEDAGETRLRE